MDDPVTIQPTEGLNVLTVILIVLAAVLIVALICFLVFRSRKKKNQEEHVNISGQTAGKRIPTYSLTHCKACGAQLNPKSDFCLECGAKVRSTTK